MRDLLPDFVAVEVATDADFGGELLPAEEATLNPRAVPNRRREFTAGRMCARRALSSLGLPAHPIPAAQNRAPIWPPGTTGSITHTAGYCAAAVTSNPAVRAVGIDAESRTILPHNVRRQICLPDELAWCAERPDEDWWPAVFFSAKEVVFKLWSPITGAWLGFHDAHLTIDPRAGTFEAAIAPALLAKSPAAPPTFNGRFHIAPAVIRTAAIATY